MRIRDWETQKIEENFQGKPIQHLGMKTHEISIWHEM